MRALLRNPQVRRYLSDAFCSPLGLTTGACSRSLAWWAFCIRRFWGRLPEHIVGDVSMAAPLFASTAVASAIALVASRRGNPAAAYKACLPVMLVVLSLMPFIGDALGPISGTIMIMCYDVCGMLFLFYIANASRETGVSSFALSGIYLIGSNAFLAFGLAAGLVVGAFSASRGVSLLTLLAFVALYPLGIAFVFAMRHSEREIDGGGASVLGAESTEGGRVFGDASEGDGAEGSVASSDVRANVRLGAMKRLGIRRRRLFGKALSRRARPCRMFHR